MDEEKNSENISDIPDIGYFYEEEEELPEIKEIKKPEKPVINTQKYIKIILPAVLVLALIIYMVFSPDPIASLYRSNFQKNIEWLFPVVYQNKTPIDYTSDELTQADRITPQEDEFKEIEKQSYEASKNDEAKLSVTIPFENAANSQFAVFSSGVLCADSKRLYYINTRGETVLDMETGIVDPILKTNGSYALLAQEGGSNIELYENNELVYSTNINENIVSCNLSSKGDVVLVTDRKNYKGGILVYNKSGEQVFSWASGQGYIMSADISSTTRNIAAALISTENEVSSSVLVFDINSGEYGNKLNFEDTLLFDVNFTGDIITAFGDNSMITITQSEEILSDRRFDNVELSHFAYDMKGNKAVIFDNNNLPAMQTYNQRGSLKNEILLTHLAEYLSVNGKYVVYNDGRDVILKNEASDSQKVYRATMDVLGLRLITKNTFAIIHSNSIEIVKM